MMHRRRRVTWGMVLLAAAVLVMSECGWMGYGVLVREPRAAVMAALPSLLPPSAPAWITPASNVYRVVKVVDGDTIKVLRNGATTTVRLIGADTPEVVDPRKPVQCFGPEASAETKRLIAASADEVRLESDPTQSEYDQYGRLLAYVYLQDGTLLERQLIATGFAREYTFKNRPYEFQSQFRAAQANARTANLGLWSPSTCGGGR